MSDLAARLNALLNGGSGSHAAAQEIQRGPGAASSLLAVIEAYGRDDSSVKLLAAQILQKALRRCPLQEAPDVTRLLNALRTSHSAIIVTQIALSVSVLLFRMQSVPPTQFLAALHAEMQDAKPGLCAVLTIIAEEVLEPAAKISVAPERAGLVRSELREGAAAVLNALHDWTVAGHVGLIYALRCGHAWCAAGLVTPGVAMSSALLLERAIFGMQVETTDPSLAAEASETLCGVLAAASLDQAHFPEFAMRVFLHVSALAISARIASVASTACSLLAKCLALSVGDGGAAPSALQSWLSLLMRASEVLPLAEAGVVNACWIELHDVSSGASDALDGETWRSTALQQAFSALLSSFRLPLLESVVKSGGALPLDFEHLSLEERGECEDGREECRALLRGAVYVGDDIIDAAIDGLRQHAEAAVQAATVAGGGAGEASLTANTIAHLCDLEAALHAMSAVSKPLGHRACPPLSAVFASLLPAAARLTSSILSSNGAARGFARGLLTTMLILIGSLSVWLSGVERTNEVASILPIVLASISVPEEEETGVWPLRSKQEHAGCVAVMKLCAAGPGSVLKAEPLERVLAVLHAASAQTSSTCLGISARSSDLLLGAASDLVSHTCRYLSAKDDVTALAQALLSPPLTEISTAANSHDERALSSALRAARRLASILVKLPDCLQGTAAELISPLAVPLSQLMLVADTSSATLAAQAIASVCDACGPHAATLLPTFADATLAVLRSSPACAIQLTCRIAQCGALAAWSADAGDLNSEACKHAFDVASKVVENVSAQMAALEQSHEGSAALAYQNQLAEWFDSTTTWIGEKRPHAQNLAALLAPSLPHITMAMRKVVTRPSPAEIADTQQGVVAVKRALYLLRAMAPPPTVGVAFCDYLARTSAATLDAASLDVVGLKRTVSAPCLAAVIIGEVLMGLAAWMPSWLLSDVVECFWSMRNTFDSQFRVWLQGALAQDGVPRPSLTAEQKAGFFQAMVDAKGKSQFKAAIKQLCGGKKKHTVGTPPLAPDQ